MKTCPSGHHNHESYKFCIQCGQKLDSTLKAGQLIHKRYRVEKVLSSAGGFGITYLVQDQDMFNELRVLKQLKDSRNDKKALQLFQREAKTLSQLHHPQVPKLHAFFSDKNGYYLVQDYIEGQTLSDIMLTQGSIHSDFALDILEQTLKILSYIHSIPLLHRDIKPANLIWGMDSKIYLIDFGAVKEIFKPDDISTATPGNTEDFSSQTVIYTKGYAPPEQTMGKVYPQSDLYALGASLIELLTAKPLPQLYDVLERIFVWENEAQSTSPHLIAILNHLTKEAVKDRYSSSEEVLKAIGTPYTSFGGIEQTSTASPISSRREWLILPGQQSIITAISWFQNEALAIGCQNGDITLKSIPDGQTKINFNSGTQAIKYLQWIPENQQFLVHKANHQVSMYQIINGKPQQIFSLNPEVDKIVLSPDQTTIAGYKNDCLYLWSATSGQLLNKLYQTNQHSISSLAWRDDSQFVILGTASGHLLLWEIMTEQLIADWVAHQSSIRQVHWDHEGQTILSIGADNCLKQWEAYTNQFLTEIVLSQEPHLTDWNSIKKLVALITLDNQVELWTPLRKKEILLAQSQPEVLAWSPNNQYLAVASQQVHLWNDF